MLKSRIFLGVVILGLIVLGVYALFSETFVKRRYQSTDDFFSPIIDIDNVEDTQSAHK